MNGWINDVKRFILIKQKNELFILLWAYRFIKLYTLDKKYSYL